MEKTRGTMITALIIVCVICIIFAVNLVALNAQLNTLKSKAARCDTLETELADLKARYDDQALVARNTQDSLDAAMKELDSLRAINLDLETRLNAALGASSTTAEDASEASMPIIE
jgi:biopolymer transport protein ExbB/TolQ